MNAILFPSIIKLFSIHFYDKFHSFHNKVDLEMFECDSLTGEKIDTGDIVGNRFLARGRHWIRGLGTAIKTWLAVEQKGELGTFETSYIS